MCSDVFSHLWAANYDSWYLISAFFKKLNCFSKNKGYLPENVKKLYKIVYKFRVHRNHVLLYFYSSNKIDIFNKYLYHKNRIRSIFQNTCKT